MSKNKATFQILLCAALWSTAGIFMKWIPWSGFVIASFRSLLSGGVMVAFMAVNHFRFRINKRTLFGGISLAGTMLLFSVANKMTTAANAIVLQYTSPIWIVLLSAAFLHKRFHKADMIAVALAFFGIALFFADGLGAGNTAGNLVALGAGLSFGCYYISLGEGTEDERTSAVLVANIITFLIGLPFVATTQPQFDSVSVSLIIFLGIFQLGIPYVLLAHASGWCPPLVCSLLGALEPLLNPVWVAIFDGEMPGALALVGGVIVIATIAVWYIYDDKKAKEAVV